MEFPDGNGSPPPRTPANQPPMAPPVPSSRVESAQPAPPRKRRNLPAAFAAFGGAIAGTILTLGALTVAGVFDAPVIPAPVIVERTINPQSNVIIQPDSDMVSRVTAVAAKATPSIVTIEIRGSDGAASGSGVVLDASGLIVTNHHVVEGASAIEVVFSDGAVYTAELIGSDPLTDVAAVRVIRDGLTPIEVSDLTAASIGDLAVAVGNPLGLRGGPSVTSGVISAFGRTLDFELGDTLYGLIQTDAPITRGSSGGALLDESGLLIGITTAIGVSDVGAEGLGFAIPVDLVLGVVDDLVADGEVRHAFLGIQGQTATVETEPGARVPIGAEITDFPEVSAIEDAGAQIGDVITELEAIPISTLDELVATLRTMRAGQTVVVTIERAGEPISLDVVLGEYPQ